MQKAIQVITNRKDLTPTQFKILLLLNKARSFPRPIQALSRIEIVITLHIPWTTSFDNLKKLLKWGLIDVFGKNDGMRGRPTKYWQITEKGVGLLNGR